VTEDYKSTIEQLRRFAINAARLERLEEEKAVQEKRLSELAEEISESKVEIEKIRDNSFMNIYMKLTNQLDAHFKIQEQYFLDLSLEYNDVSEALIILNYEIQILKNNKLEYQSFKSGLKKKMNKFRNKVQDTRVESYIKVTKDLEDCLKLRVELEEATNLGFEMIDGLAEGIRYITDASNKGEFGKIKEPNSKLERQRFSLFKDRDFKEYQSIILPLRHNFIKFIGEVNDVYIIILRRKKLPMKVINKFTNNYLRSLATDMRRAKNFTSSIRFLNQYKDRVEVLTTLMEDDLLVVDQDIKNLESKEAEIIRSLVE